MRDFTFNKINLPNLQKNNYIPNILVILVIWNYINLFEISNYGRFYVHKNLLYYMYVMIHTLLCAYYIGPHVGPEASATQKIAASGFIGLAEHDSKTIFDSRSCTELFK